MKCISVTLVVHRHKVHHKKIVSQRIHASHPDLKGRKHPPVENNICLRQSERRTISWNGCSIWTVRGEQDRELRKESGTRSSTRAIVHQFASKRRPFSRASDRDASDYHLFSGQSNPVSDFGRNRSPEPTVSSLIRTTTRLTAEIRTEV